MVRERLFQLLLSMLKSLNNTYFVVADVDEGQIKEKKYEFPERVSLLSGNSTNPSKQYTCQTTTTFIQPFH